VVSTFVGIIFNNVTSPTGLTPFFTGNWAAYAENPDTASHILVQIKVLEQQF
jgi:hypothetical protein